MRHTFFAVDLGATSGRTILASLTEKGIELEEVNRFPNHLIDINGHTYWDINELYRHIIEGMKIVAGRNIAIDSIGIDTWGVDFVCIGKDGHLLRQPYAYRDAHTNGAPEEFFKKVPRDEVYQITGIQVMNFNSLYQLDTMRRNNDSALEAADKIAFMPDALSYMLTGNLVTEYTIASTSQMLDAKTQRFSARLLDTIGLKEENFGKFVFPGETIGILTPEVQKETGLGSIPVVAVAGHDTGSAVAAVPALDKNFAYLSSGTWSLIGIETEEAVINDETARLNFTNEGGIGGTIRLLKNICGMWLLERCRKEWPERSYPELIAEAQACEPFRSLINPDDAIFANPASMVDAICEYCKSTGQPIPESQGQFTRCIFESLALRYKEVLEDLQKLSANPIETLHIIGGGSRNALLNQFTADAIGIKVVAGPSEATAIGNVMVQAMATGVVDGIPAMRKLIDSSIPLSTYLANHTSVWENAYTNFKKYSHERRIN